jgi:copper resistance protein B
MRAGLRLRYEITRQLAPYMGVNWDRAFGKTADLQRRESGKVSSLRLTAGVRAWF